MTFQKSYPLTRYGVNLLKVNATIGGVYKNDCQRLSLLVDTGASFTFNLKLIKEVKLMEDELKEEYDLTRLKVRKMGSQCKSFGETVVKLDLDVAEVFPNAEIC